MLKRLRQIVRLSKYDDPILERIDTLAAAIEEAKRLSNNGVVPEGFEWTGELKPIDQDPNVKMVTAFVSASKKAFEDKGEFLPDMTEDEVLAYERAERDGWKKFRLPFTK